MPAPTQITDLLDKLIADAEELIATSSMNVHNLRVVRPDNRDRVRRWANELALIDPWRGELKHDGDSTLTIHLECCLSALQVIDDAMKQGLLGRYEDLVFAQAFGNLFEQGEHLFEQGYFLAAGVIFRAVLEEKLRRMCDVNSCLPTKKMQRSTITTRPSTARRPPFMTRA